MLIRCREGGMHGVSWARPPDRSKVNSRWALHNPQSPNCGSFRDSYHETLRIITNTDTFRLHKIFPAVALELGARRRTAHLFCQFRQSESLQKLLLHLVGQFIYLHHSRPARPAPATQLPFSKRRLSDL